MRWYSLNRTTSLPSQSFIAMKGETLALCVNSPLASRTNTNNADRATRDPSGLTAAGYECVQTNSDTHIRYAKLDMWAKFTDFQSRVSAAIVEQQSRDRIMIGFNGFNGVSAAATTDITANPLLQDVNKGWLEHIRAFNAGSRVLDEGEVEDGSEPDPLRPDAAPAARRKGAAEGPPVDRVQDRAEARPPTRLPAVDPRPPRGR